VLSVVTKFRFVQFLTQFCSTFSALLVRLEGNYTMAGMSSTCLPKVKLSLAAKTLSEVMNTENQFPSFRTR
jgi:hypothetical protein